MAASYMEVNKSPSDEYSLQNRAVISDKEPLTQGGGEHKSVGFGIFVLWND